MAVSGVKQGKKDLLRRMMMRAQNRARKRTRTRTRTGRKKEVVWLASFVLFVVSPQRQSPQLRCFYGILVIALCDLLASTDLARDCCTASTPAIIQDTQGTDTHTHTHTPVNKRTNNTERQVQQNSKHAAKSPSPEQGQDRGNNASF